MILRVILFKLVIRQSQIGRFLFRVGEMISKKKLLLEKFSKTGILFGGELLLSHPEALKFIKQSREQGILILGMDFYKKIDDEITPLLCSADYSELVSNVNGVELSANEALSLLKDGFPDSADFVSFVI
jgi:hypothetical protein